MEVGEMKWLLKCSESPELVVLQGVREYLANALYDRFPPNNSGGMFAERNSVR